jgi:septal ring factor EnvC (AmiA/AmiB activator)
MGLKQFVFCDSCKKEVEGGSPPSVWVRIQKVSNGTTEMTTICDSCALILKDVFDMLTSGKTPEISEIPVLRRALAEAANDNARADSTIRSYEDANKRLRDEIHTLNDHIARLNEELSRWKQERNDAWREVGRLRQQLAVPKRKHRK